MKEIISGQCVRWVSSMLEVSQLEMKMTHGLDKVVGQTFNLCRWPLISNKSKHKYWIAMKKRGSNPIFNIFMPFDSFMNVFWITSNWVNHKDYMGKLNIDLVK